MGMLSGRASPSGQLSSDWVKIIYQDRSGILWVGTDNGISKAIPQPKNFKHIQFVLMPIVFAAPGKQNRRLVPDQTGTVWGSMRRTDCTR
jgi:ligand-binding sensor domain-containing protein